MENDFDYQITIPHGGLLNQVLPPYRKLPGVNKTFRDQMIGFVDSCYRVDEAAAFFL